MPPLLLATVQQETGIFDLAFDADGDIGVSFGSANAYVRLVGDPPHVRIHSPLVRGIDATPALLARINELNCAVIHPHFLFIGGAICAVTDVPASPYVPEHVAHALQELCKVSESIAELLQAEFSEGTTFGAAMSSALKH